METTIKANIEMEAVSSLGLSSPKVAIRYKGQWFKITPKPYESERQTSNVAWKFLKEQKPILDVYREWYAQEEEDAKLLYPFRKG